MSKLIQLLMLFGTLAWAQDGEVSDEGDETPQAAVQTKDEGGVLDFEGDVIEGQRKRPDLFLQSEVQNLTLDAILYLRKDFNDFHQVDRSRRPGYYQRRTRGGNP
jgi:hypothetical protein